MTKEMGSLRQIEVYGDMLMELPQHDVLLPPASMHSPNNHLSLIGTLPPELRKVRDPLQISFKSSKAQAGMEIMYSHFDPELLFVLIANCGPYWLKVLSGEDPFDLGAVYSMSEGAPSKADIYKFMGKLRDSNPWLTKEKMQPLKLGSEHYVWIETPTLIGPKVESSADKAKVVNIIPRGTNRKGLGEFLDRKVICHRTDKKKPSHVVSGTVPYSTTQTEEHIVPVEGMGMIIQGSAVLNKSGNLVSHLVHGASQLVAQPDCTMKIGRDAHPIIAEFFTKPVDVVKKWKSGLRIGFFAQPVHLSVNS